jgi:hypothetical protein
MTETHKGEKLTPVPYTFQVEMGIENLKMYKSPGFYHIPGD